MQGDDAHGLVSAGSCARTVQAYHWRRCCTDRRSGCSTPQPHLGSCEADGDRASRLRHAVQSMDGYANLGAAAAVLAKAQTVTDHLFVASDGGLNPAALGVARNLLPADPALFGDALQMTVPPGGRGSGRLAQHRRGAWRHDDRSVGVAVD